MTLFRLPVLTLPFSPTSAGLYLAAFPFAIKTPGICVNCALVYEIMLSGMISEVLFRITTSLCFMRCIYENLPLNLRWTSESFWNWKTIVNKRSKISVSGECQGAKKCRKIECTPRRKFHICIQCVIPATMHLASILECNFKKLTTMLKK